MASAALYSACPDCDVLVDLHCLRDVAGTANVLCPRCGAELARRRGNTLEKAVALAIAALILMLLANIFPILGLDIQGRETETTLFGAAWRLWEERMPLLGLLLLATTVIVPLIELAALLWLVVPLWRGRRPAGFARIFRILRLAQPWAMVEVFMLGVLVALVKLSHMAEVLPGVGIFCFGGLMLILTWLGALLDGHLLWRVWEEAGA